MNIAKHIIHKDLQVKNALLMLNELGADAILFVVDDKQMLLGSLTDGDLRRGFIKGLSFENTITNFIQPNPVFIYQDDLQVAQIDFYREKFLKIIPVIDRNKVIVDILNLRLTHSLVPVDAVIMAGGRGQRLMPLTKDVPKPMLQIGSKPILEHNIDRLKKFGINHIYISVNYLANVIEEHFGNGQSRDLKIEYIRENKPMGTIGSIKLVPNFSHDYVLVMNSDLLTNIDFSDFFQTFQQSGADMAVAATTYDVNIPYAVMEIDENNRVSALKEKPRYTYYSNAGIYLFKKDVLTLIPEQEFFDVTDLMDLLIRRNRPLITYPIIGYWLDIGKHEDFEKAQKDIHHIKL